MSTIGKRYETAMLGSNIKMRLESLAAMHRDAMQASTDATPLKAKAHGYADRAEVVCDQLRASLAELEQLCAEFTAEWPHWTEVR